MADRIFGWAVEQAGSKNPKGADGLLAIFPTKRAALAYRDEICGVHKEEGLFPVARCVRVEVTVKRTGGKTPYY